MRNTEPRTSIGILVLTALLASVTLLPGCGLSKNLQPMVASSSKVTFKRVNGFPAFPEFYAVIKSNCVSCHVLGFSGGDFAKLKTEADWEVSGLIVPGDPLESSIYYRLAHSDGPLQSQIYKNMPPSGSLSTANLEVIKSYILGLARRPGSCTTSVPEFVRLRRFNRREYNNTVRDLIGINTNPAQYLPPDEPDTKGFDTNPDNLGVSTEYAVTAVGTAEKLADQMIALSPLPGPFNTCSATDRNCIKGAMNTFTSRAFRRPVSPSEVDALMTLSDAAGGGLKGLGAALFGVLSSQNFHFRLEIDPLPSSVRNLSDYEMASRLSYFIWSSMPDAALFTLASQGKLQDPAVLRSEVTRMIQSSKAREFINGFGAQLLRLDRIGLAQPNAATYPAYDDSLKASMVNESLAFFEDVILNKLSTHTLLDANYTFVNAQLANHYGIPGTFSAQNFTKATFPADSQRSGVLTQSAMLTMNAGAYNGSPTRRGKWIMDRLLCNEPKPAPPGVINALPPAAQTAGMTGRQIMELHAKNVACASCHRVMDPIGFGLDHFDAIGKFRMLDGSGKAIDGTGSVFQKNFSSPQQLAEIIGSRPELNVCLTKMMYTYALSTPKTTGQLCAVKNVASQLTTGKDTLPDMIAELVLSTPFRQRASEAR